MQDVLQLKVRGVARLATLSLISISLFVSFLPTAMAGPATAEYLRQIAREYRQAERFEDAAHELHKALMIDPGNEQIRRDLNELESLMSAKRDQALSDALSSAAKSTGIAQPPRSPMPAVVPSAPSIPAGRSSLSTLPSAFIRVPDPSVTGISWFYVFGRSGKPDYGALAQPLEFVVDVPRTTNGQVAIRVLDAQTHGANDERDGAWDTATAFRVFRGTTLLSERAIDASAPEGTVAEFGPWPVTQGEAQGDRVFFRLEVEGLQGDDNNLFAFEISPPDAQLFSYNPSIRLARTKGQRMHLFPAIPVGTTRIRAANYDLDPDGGRIMLRPITRDGRELPTIPLPSSGSAHWAAADVEVPAGADGTRWICEIVKATQVRGNMSVRITDQAGRPLPIYATPLGGQPVETVSPPEPVRPVARSPLACNAFEFDASSSFDRDRQPLSYTWDFGDGTAATGVRARHEYTKAGDYTVRLTVNDGTTTSCCGVSTTQTVHANLPPVPVLGAPTNACVGSAVAFSAAQSTDSPDDTLRYLWEFGDGSTGEGRDTSHVYAGGGTYPITLRVDDQRGTPCSVQTATARLRVNAPPVARIADVPPVCAMHPTDPLQVAFNAGGSTDPDRDALTYQWDFGDGSTGTGPHPMHRYERGGRYTATVTVNDGSGTVCAASSARVGILANHAPVAVAPAPVMSCPSDPVTLDAGRSTDPDDDTLTYRWAFGDGQEAAGPSVTHTYERSGTYPVRITVDDGSRLSCASTTAFSSVTVNTPPVPQMVIRGAEGEPTSAATTRSRR